MSQPKWTSTVPEKPGHYFIRKEIDTGVKRVLVAEFLGDEDIWVPGKSRAVTSDELRDWEWWTMAIDPPPRA